MIAPTRTLAIACLLAARVAAADCALPAGGMQTASVDAVFLGRYEDILGHAASFFFDATHHVVIGPVDHEGWPGSRLRAAALPSNVTAGAIGKLTLHGWFEHPDQLGAASGFFVGFVPGRARADLDAIVDQLDSWFVIGLLAGRSPVEAHAARRFDTLRTTLDHEHDREHLAAAAEGILDSAPLARAQSLLGTYGFRDVAGTRLDRIATLVRGGRKALAALPAEPVKSSWTDYLPELAAAWDKHAGDLRPIVDDLALGQPAPSLPELPSHDPIFSRHHCGPAREEIRGRFIGPDELTAEIVLEALRAVDRRFGDKVAEAFTGLSAGVDQLVIAVRTIDHRDIAFLAGRGTTALSAIEVTAAQAATLAVGTKLRYVARGGRKLMLPLFDAAAVGLAFDGAVTRLDAGPVDIHALIETLQHESTSGNLGFGAGESLAALFELAGHVPGWKLEDARAYAWSLPGNVYDSPRQWADTWSDILVWAIRFAPDAAFSDELERGLPTIIAQFGRRGKQRSVAIPAEVVRTFAIQLAVQIAARRILANDLAGAERVLSRAGGPLGAIAGAAQLGPETQRDPNHALELATMQALVATLRNQPVTLPPDGDRERGMLLVLGALRPYAAAIRAPWIAALVAAGFPKPPG